MSPSDEALMLAYAGGDAGAFEALYGKHKGGLFRFVLRSVKARGEAEEIFQDIWMRVIEARDTLDRLAAAIAALPMAQREVFLLHHEGDLTVAEIAAATGTNEEAAKSRLRYAMNKLKEAIDDG